MEKSGQVRRSVACCLSAADNAHLAEEIVVVEPRQMLLLPLDDLLAITREFLNPDVSCCGLSRCLRRHKVGNLNTLKVRVSVASGKGFKAYEPGFLHADVKYLTQMPDETGRR